MKHQKTIIFDIETGPLPVDQINIPPFEPPANIKDPVKIADREEAYRREFIEKAALSPLTGQVLAIGFKHTDIKDVEFIYSDGIEKLILADFWSLLDNCRELTGTYPILVGFNSNSFDLPFLVRRSWALGITPSIDAYRAGRYWSDRNTIDLREVWQLGDRMAPGSLDAICRALGLGEKTGNGAQFAELYQTDPQSALEYLRHDVLLTEALYKRLVPQF